MDNEKNTQHIVVAAVVRQGSNIAMVEEGKETIRGLWNLPTGHVEPGENIIAATVREAREETGLDIILTAILGIENYVVADGSQYVKFIFLAEAPAHDTLHVDGAEIISARWVPIEEIKTMGDKLRKPQTVALVLERLAGSIAYPLELLQDYL